MPLRWAIFRVLCIVQIALIGLLVVEFGYIFDILDVGSYTLIVLFAVLGLKLVARNYPDDPPTGSQKIYFNWLYILNFFNVSYLLAASYVRVKLFLRQDSFIDLRFGSSMLDGTAEVIFVLLLLLHLYILYMMFRLRRELYANYIKFNDSLGEKR